MGRNVGIFRTPAYLHHLIHFVFVGQVEGDRTIDLVQAQSRIMRLDRFWIFAISILPNNAINRHTTPHDVEASFAPLNVILRHVDARFQSNGLPPDGALPETKDSGPIRN